MRKPGRKLFGLSGHAPAEGGNAAETSGPASLDRAAGIQRLQVGLFGIAAMVLLVGLASIIGSQADRADEAAVPDAAPTTEPRVIMPGTNAAPDALVVPDIPTEPSPAPLLDPLVLPPPTSSPAVQPSGAPGASPKP
ncbi:MAG: hypothetical protein ACK4IS_06155 [Erythrobacter sp.]